MIVKDHPGRETAAVQAEMAGERPSAPLGRATTPQSTLASVLESSTDTLVEHSRLPGTSGRFQVEGGASARGEASSVASQV